MNPVNDLLPTTRKGWAQLVCAALAMLVVARSNPAFGLVDAALVWPLGVALAIAWDRL